METLNSEQIIEEINKLSLLPIITRLYKTGDILWSDVFGEVEFIEVHDRSGGRPMIKVRTRTGECRNITPTGRLGYNYNDLGSCILWPDKKRSWIEKYNEYKEINKPIETELDTLCGSGGLFISNSIAARLGICISHNQKVEVEFDGKKLIAYIK